MQQAGFSGGHKPYQTHDCRCASNIQVVVMSVHYSTYCLTAESIPGSQSQAESDGLNLMHTPRLGPFNHASSGDGVSLPVLGAGRPPDPCSLKGKHCDCLHLGNAGKGEETGKPVAPQNGLQSSASMPHPVDSTTRAQPAQVKASMGLNTPAAWPAVPLRNALGTPASVNGGLLTGIPHPDSLSLTLPASMAGYGHCSGFWGIRRPPGCCLGPLKILSIL